MRRALPIGTAAVLILVGIWIRSRPSTPDRRPPAASDRGHDHPPSPAPPPSAPGAAGVEAPSAGERKTGGYIRLRRPDGSYEVVEETVELMSRLTSGLMAKAVARFESVRSEFRARVRRTLKDEGPAAAWGLLKPLLRSPERSNDDKAFVYEAVTLAIQLQAARDVPEPVRRGFGADVAEFLTSDAAHAWIRRAALEILAGQPPVAGAAGPNQLVIDGLPAHDPEAIWDVFLLPNRSGMGASDAVLLQDPAVVDACLRLLRAPDAPLDLRATALTALGTRPDALEKLDLLALARDPEPEVGIAAARLLARTPDRVPPKEFFALLDARDDPRWKSDVFEALAGPAFASPDMTAVLMRDLPSRPVPFAEAAQSCYRSVVLDGALQRYGVSKDRGLFDLLCASIPSWAGFQWDVEGSPVVAVAEHAARHRLKEFAAPLRASLPALASADDRQHVQEALDLLSR
ncbi:MAG TPA: hypothetical protein VF950_09900 [Planctomycetota bacterium]